MLDNDAELTFGRRTPPSTEEHRRNNRRSAAVFGFVGVLRVFVFVLGPNWFDLTSAVFYALGALTFLTAPYVENTTKKPASQLSRIAWTGLLVAAPVLLGLALLIRPTFEGYSTHEMARVTGTAGSLAGSVALSFFLLRRAWIWQRTQTS